MRFALALACLSLGACSCGSTVSMHHPDGGGGSDLGGGGDAAPHDDGGGGPDGSAVDAPSSPEVCDGIDNDHNGIIDDVDVGHDGVCDCLRIATLGVAGSAGTTGVFDAWLTARSMFPADHLGDAVLTPALLAPYQIIVSQDISGGHARTPDEVAALDAWVRAGGGFMTLIGYADTSERTNVNALLAPSGIQYGPEAILCGCGFTLPIDTWHPHPISDRVTRLGIDNGYPVNGSGTNVAEQSGWVVLRAAEVGAGHVVVWGDEWISFDSEWTMHPDYQVELFWLNCFKWLSPPTQCQVPILI